MLSRLLFLLAALVNLAPIIGVLSVDRIEALYGIEVQGADLAILLRHRAVLFGIVGALLALAGFRKSLRPVAITMGLVSMLSFVALALLVGHHGEEIGRVVLVDLAASVLLVGAAIASKLGR